MPGKRAGEQRLDDIEALLSSLINNGGDEDALPSSRRQQPEEIEGDTNCPRSDDGSNLRNNVQMPDFDTMLQDLHHKSRRSNEVQKSQRKAPVRKAGVKNDKNAVKPSKRISKTQASKGSKAKTKSTSQPDKQPKSRRNNRRTNAEEATAFGLTSPKERRARRSSRVAEGSPDDRAQKDLVQRFKREAEQTLKRKSEAKRKRAMKDMQNAQGKSETSMRNGAGVASKSISKRVSLLKKSLPANTKRELKQVQDSLTKHSDAEVTKALGMKTFQVNVSKIEKLILSQRTESLRGFIGEQNKLVKKTAKVLDDTKVFGNVLGTIENELESLGPQTAQQRK